MRLASVLEVMPLDEPNWLRVRTSESRAKRSRPSPMGAWADSADGPTAQSVTADEPAVTSSALPRLKIEKAGEGQRDEVEVWAVRVGEKSGEVGEPTDEPRSEVEE